MLAYNEMEQGQHGYSASQVMWGQGMNLPLTHGMESTKVPDQHQFVKNMGRKLREIRDKVRPFNKNKEKVTVKGTGRSEGVLFYLQSSEHEFIIRD